MGSPHILVIPYPAQGHVIPLMEMSQCLVNHGFKITITFVNTEFNHKQGSNALTDADEVRDQIRLVSIPDGLEPWENRNDLGKSTESMFRVMPGKLEELIREINGSESDDDIICVVADMTVGWALEVANKMGIRRAAVCPSAVSNLVLAFHIPLLIDDGIIDNNGTPLKNQMIQFSPTMPAMDPANFLWACMGDLTTQKIIFDLGIKNNKALKGVEWQLCNSTYDLEPAAFALAPEIQPIGPLLASTRQGISAGHFWAEDSTCLKWLDQQQPCSVVYVAFGSFTVFDETQFQELALGLELSNRPFLWVVRPDITNGTKDAYPDGFQERVATRGRTIGWAPQQKVLRHPSVACFMSHCGWNSTMEGVSNGVPFMCWPYFADQFINEAYICNVWKTGLGFRNDENGIITHEEIKTKVEQLLGDDNVKTRAMDLKEKTMSSVEENGCSYKNMKKFIEWMKA